MVFVTEVDLPETSYCRPLAPGAFRNVRHGALRRWREERVVAAAVRRERCVAAVDSLRDEVLGRAPAKAASKELVLRLPPLPPLKDFTPERPLPFFFSADSLEAPEACTGPVHRHGRSMIPPCLHPAGAPDLLTASYAKVDRGDLTVAFAADHLRPLPQIDAAAQRISRIGAVESHLHGSSSWSRLPGAKEVAGPKRLSKAAPQQSASQPLLAKVPAKPAAPVRELLPFQSLGAMPRPEAWAPLLGERARRAELQMQQRLRA